MGKNIVSILFILYGLTATAQVPQSKVLVDVSVFPIEKAMLYINSDIVLAGETLLYKIYVLNDLNAQSILSKIAYVSFRDQNDSIIFNHKLKLENGSANSDFFLPANLKTGIYRLIGYTNFSRNNSVKPFDEKSIYVINTFMENNSEAKSSDTIRINAITQEVGDFSNQYKVEKQIQISTDKHTYGYREKVSLSFDPSIEKGRNYLLSVRRVNPIEISGQIPELSSNNSSRIFYVPELRGEVISGMVLSKVDGHSVPNKEVSLTIPGKDFIFKLAKTAENGRFFFSVLEDYNSEKSVLKIVGAKKDTEDLSIVLDIKDLVLNRTENTVLKLNPNLKEWLQERSVQIQIENAYFEKKRDSIFPRRIHPFFYDDLGTVYLLDDFTRFSTIRETFTEIIKLAAIRGSGENTRFMVYNPYDPKGIGKFNDIPPLVIMDGTMIQDNDALLKYSARNIKSIRVINNPYRYGPKLFSGIISIETIKGEFMLSDTANAEVIDLPPTVREKEYFNPDYLKDLSSRIPDYRVQLLWNPNVDLSTESSTSFYTSDVPGIYEIRLEDINENGLPQMFKSYFEVR